MDHCPFCKAHEGDYHAKTCTLAANLGRLSSGRFAFPVYRRWQTMR